jgi:Zonular occludens toxin (Zot)
VIALIVGPPGSGKSYTSVALIAEALRSGRPVATNIELSEDWPERVARTYPLARFRGEAWRARKATELRRLVHISSELSDLFRVRLAPCLKCSSCKRSRTCRKEGRGVMVLDEAHNWMNARTWDSDGESDSKKEAVQRRLKVVRFFSQHRKLGWTVHLITQDENNVDRQVRTLFECLVRLRNLRNFKVMGIRPIPVNLFLAIWQWNDPSKSILRRETRRLNRRVAGLYDSMALSHGIEDDAGDPLWLPHPPGHGPAGAGPPAASAAGAAPAPSPSAPSPIGSAPPLAPVPAPRSLATAPPPDSKTAGPEGSGRVASSGARQSLPHGPDNPAAGPATGRRLSNSRLPAKLGGQSKGAARVVLLDRPVPPGG